MKFLIVLAFLLVAKANIIPDPNYCYATDLIKIQQPQWNDRTALRNQRGASVNPNVSQCTPTKFWIYMRHGDRLPETSVINQMVPFSQTQRENIIDAFLAGRSGLCPQDFALINNWNWNPNITSSIQLFLTVSGWDAMKELAQRYQSYFPTLLPRVYTPSQFKFRHSDRQRTQASVRAFVDGLFGENAWQNVDIQAPPNPDYLLRPQDNCPLFNEVSNTQVVRNQWENSAGFQAMVTRINDKLGLQGAQRLDATQVHTMSLICQFEQLWYPERIAPFCGAISPYDNLRLEYLDDIDRYYFSGWGLNPSRLGENLSCSLMQDLLSFLTSNNTNEETVRAYSSHQTALHFFTMALDFLGKILHLLQKIFINK